MSEEYYVVNRKRKKEYDDFVDFWENKLYPSFVQQLKEYGEKVDGELINFPSCDTGKMVCYN